MPPPAAATKTIGVAACSSPGSSVSCASVRLAAVHRSKASSAVIWDSAGRATSVQPLEVVVAGEGELVAEQRQRDEGQDDGQAAEVDEVEHGGKGPALHHVAQGPEDEDDRGEEHGDDRHDAEIAGPPLRVAEDDGHVHDGDDRGERPGRGQEDPAPGGGVRLERPSRRESGEAPPDDGAGTGDHGDHGQPAARALVQDRRDRGPHEADGQHREGGDDQEGRHQALHRGDRLDDVQAASSRRRRRIAGRGRGQREAEQPGEEHQDAGGQHAGAPRLARSRSGRRRRRRRGRSRCRSASRSRPGPGPPAWGWRRYRCGGRWRPAPRRTGP